MTYSNLGRTFTLHLDSLEKDLPDGDTLGSTVSLIQTGITSNISSQKSIIKYTTMDGIGTPFYQPILLDDIVITDNGSRVVCM